MKVSVPVVSVNIKLIKVQLQPISIGGSGSLSFFPYGSSIEKIISLFQGNALILIDKKHLQDLIREMMGPHKELVAIEVIEGCGSRFLEMENGQHFGLPKPGLANYLEPGLTRNQSPFDFFPQRPFK